MFASRQGPGNNLNSTTVLSRTNFFPLKISILAARKALCNRGYNDVILLYVLKNVSVVQKFLYLRSCLLGSKDKTLSS
jgi:hypothetical protein